MQIAHCNVEAFDRFYYVHVQMYKFLKAVDMKNAIKLLFKNFFFDFPLTVKSCKNVHGFWVQENCFLQISVNHSI